jgi:two-component system, NarL family, sensor histidine kinase UhpB
VLVYAPQPSDRYAAFGLIAAISIIFVFTVPFAALPLERISLFIPLYDGAVVINDLVTAALFAALFWARGDRGLLFLAAGYLWTVLLTPAHSLSFPGALTPTGLWAGPQTAVWALHGMAYRAADRGDP